MNRIERYYDSYTEPTITGKQWAHDVNEAYYEGYRAAQRYTTDAVIQAVLWTAVVCLVASELVG